MPFRKTSLQPFEKNVRNFCFQISANLMIYVFVTRSVLNLENKAKQIWRFEKLKISFFLQIFVPRFIKAVKFLKFFFGVAANK